MKHFFHLISLSLLLFSCGSDDSTGDDGTSTPILLSGSSVNAVASSAVSRAGNASAFSAGQTAGVFIRENTTGAASVTYTQNLEYTAVAGGGLSGDTQYYPQNGNDVIICAYSPYDSDWVSATGSYTFTVKSEQNTDAAYTAGDLLYSASGNYSKQSAAHTLTFNHLLSRLSYTLTAGEGLTSNDLTGATVKFVNLSSSVDVNLSSGKLSNLGTVTSITPHATYGAIAPPQTVSAGTQLMEITLNSRRAYYYAPTSAITLASGKHTTFEITVNQTELSVRYRVVDWDEVEGDNNGVASEFQRYKVGDYYPDPDVDLDDDAAKAAIQGVVFWVDTTADGYVAATKSGPRGKIVSLDEGTGLLWDDGYYSTGAYSTSDGLSNMAAIEQYISDNSMSWSNFPAFNFAHVKNNDTGTTYTLGATGVWYLPSKDELQYLYCAAGGKEPYTWSYGIPDPSFSVDSDSPLCQSLNSVNAGLSSDFYWSSTELSLDSAWIVDFGSGNASGDARGNRYSRVRAVSAF